MQEMTTKMITPTDSRLEPLLNFLKDVPGIDPRIGSGYFKNGNWWVKFRIDVANELAWHVVQKLGHVLNYIAIHNRLPTVFKPVAPPPGNGGPEESLSWVIESTDTTYTPVQCAECLINCLPSPVNDLEAWRFVDEDDDDDFDEDEED